MDGTIATAAPTAPLLPPRYRVLRRCVVIALALVAWNVGLWFLWNFEADRRLRAFVAERRALGEPVLAEDFAVSAVPAEENAGTALVRIGAAIGADPYLHQFSGSDYESEPFQDCDDRGRPNLAPVLPVIAEIEAALRLPGLDYGARFASGNGGEGGRKTFSVVRNVARLMRAASDAYELYGDYLGRWRVLEAMVGVAERSTSLPHGIIGVLSLHGYYREATSHIRSIVAKRPIANSAERDVVERVLLVLVREDARAPRLHQAGWWGLRFEELDSAFNGKLPAQHERGGNLLNYWWDPPEQWWILQASRVVGPLVKLDALRHAAEQSWFADACRRGDWRAGHLSAKPPGQSGLPVEWQQLLDIIDVSYPHMQSCRAMAHIRVAAVLLAARLFEYDHSALPTCLDDLVPAYLDRVPLDPFAPGDVPLRYLSDADPPRVFSVGPSGEFNGRPTRRLTQAEVERSYSFYREHIGLLPRDVAGP